MVCYCLYNLYFIVPLVLFIFLLDFYLTLKGQQYYRKYGIKHVKMGAYELNPLWVKSVRKGKYDLKHLISIFLVILGLIFIFYNDKSLIIYEFIIGFFLISWIFILSRHVQNLVYFWYIGNHPESIKGLIYKKPDLTYVQSIIGTFSLFLILFIIYIFNPSTFIIGGLSFSMLFILVQFIWFKKSIKKK